MNMNIQGRSQYFLQEGGKITGAQGKPLKLKKVIRFYPLFFGGAQINGKLNKEKY